MPVTRNELRPVRPAHYADSFWATYIISVAAASVAETVTYPLDLTKTRLQIQGEAAAASIGGVKETVSYFQHPKMSRRKQREASKKETFQGPSQFSCLSRNMSRASKCSSTHETPEIFPLSHR